MDAERGVVRRNPPRVFPAVMEAIVSVPGQDWPSADRARELYARLLAEDSTATADLAEAYLDPLVRHMARKHPNMDSHLPQTAAEDAIISLIKNPGSYKPEIAALDTYLRMAAEGDLRNLLKREERHGSRAVYLEYVELSPEAGKYLGDTKADPAHIVQEREDEETLNAQKVPIPPTVQAGLSPEEAAVLSLMRNGERKTVAYARVLAITHMHADEQRRAVKRVKDRLQKRVQRAENHGE